MMPTAAEVDETRSTESSASVGRDIAERDTEGSIAQADRRSTSARANVRGAGSMATMCVPTWLSSHRARRRSGAPLVNGVAPPRGVRSRLDIILRSEVNGTSACRVVTARCAGGAPELVLGDEEGGFGRVALDLPRPVDAGKLGIVGQGPTARARAAPRTARRPACSPRHDGSPAGT